MVKQAVVWGSLLTASVLLGACNRGGVVPTPGTPPPEQPSVTVLTAEDFREGIASLTLSRLGADESVAVIPMYGTQAVSSPSIAYSLATSGLQAAPVSGKNDRAKKDITSAAAEQHETEHGHLEHLEQDMARAAALRRSGAKTLAEGVRAQDFSNNCPGPYTVGVTHCDFHLNARSARSPFADATLRFESASAYWFVDDRYAAEFTEANLAQLAQVFENEVVSVDTYYFGNFPDFDGNGKVFIVFTSLDAYGYVSLIDLFDDDDAFAQLGVHSNEGDVFYGYLPSDNVRFESGNPNLTPEQAWEEFFSKWFPQTMVHELKHLIAGGIRLQLPGGVGALEELWAEEASAVAAEELSPYGSGSTGYAQTTAAASLQDPRKYRVVDDDLEEGPEHETGSYYGYNFLHLWRIAERVGHENFWKTWTAGPEIGVANIEKNASSLGSFADTMTDWAVTLMFDHTGLLSGYDYGALNLRDGSWQPLSYEPLLSEVMGETRSLAFYVGRGDNRDAVLSVRSSDPNPYVVVVRFTGTLPY